MRPKDDEILGAPSIPELGSVMDFMRVIWALDHALLSRSKRMEKTLGVTGPQRIIIRILGRFPGMQVGQLAQILHLAPGTLSGILKRLQRCGLITRRSDSRDHRRAELGLTAKGRALDVEATGTVETAVRTVLEGLPSSKIKNTVEVLRKLTESLERTP
jgi:MarR family transcriptional regulator, organic hydroperoxide resistance regulator